MRKLYQILMAPSFSVLSSKKALLTLETKEESEGTQKFVSNPHQAQLIFATHDVGLLSECMLRSDQIWFTEKDRFGATQLYSLAEFSERNDASYLKNYLAGRYSAIPHLNALRPYIEDQLSHGA
jgi:AAA15 family ATPase/GTPase